jgi:hypothetical protein
MSSFSDYCENAVVDHVTGKTAFTKPTATYLALFTAAPSDAGGGTEVSTSGTAYARQAITWGAASGGVASNSATVAFPTATGSGYGTVTHIGIFDASTAGNMLAWAPLAASKTVSAGDAIEFPAGSLTVSLS